jgi:hypothetical protein
VRFTPASSTKVHIDWQLTLEFISLYLAPLLVPRSMTRRRQSRAQATDRTAEFQRTAHGTGRSSQHLLRSRDDREHEFVPFSCMILDPNDRPQGFSDSANGAINDKVSGGLRQ